MTLWVQCGRVKVVHFTPRLYREGGHGRVVGPYSLWDSVSG